MSEQYKPPTGPPPSYPQEPAQTHQDAGLYGGDPRGMQQGGYYGSPPPQQGAYYGSPPPQQYGPPPMEQGPYGGQYYQQPMYYQGPPPPGTYYDQRGGPGDSGAGICAGILGAMACCCCLDILI